MGRLVIMEVLQDPFRKFKTRWFIDENGKRKLHCMIHLKPLDNPNVNWGLKMYNTECLSVVNYMDLLTTNKNYMDFQTKLLEMWSVDNYNLYDLIHTLDNYAEDKLYFDKLLNVIEGVRKEGYLND